MREASNVVVISDLHMAAKRGRGLFQADEELAVFFAWLARDVKDPTLLVINGDMLDFLVLENGVKTFESFNPDAAYRRTTAIIEHHTEVFSALADFVRSSGNSLLILGGNHDPELILPGVQKLIEKRLCGESMSVPIEWLVRGEAAAIGVAGTKILVEHGDLHDPWNSVNHKRLGEAVGLASRGFADEHEYHVPPGSALVTDHLAALSADYPWVETLKPVGRAVVPLIAAVCPPERSLRLLGAVNKFKDYVKQSAIRQFWNTVHAEKNLHRAAETSRRPDQADPVLVAKADDADESTFRSWLKWAQETGQLERGLGRDVRDAVVINWLRRVSANDGSVKIDTPDRVVPEVSMLITRGVDLVVHGHTHSSKAYYVPGGLYMNSGTWTRLVQLPIGSAPNSVWHKFLEDLGEGRADDFLRPTFVTVSAEPSSAVATAALYEWKDGQRAKQAAWRFEYESTAWIPEA